MNSALSFPTLLLVLTLTVQATAPRAAGFDCGKTTTALEKTICQDPALSAWDEQLAAAYREAGRRCSAVELKTEQQRWLKDVRNACSDAECLAIAYQQRLAELQARRCGADVCAGFGQGLIGAWRLASGTGSFEEIAFSAGQTPNQGRFDTWLHSRPEFIDGRWRLQACELRLVTPGEPDASAARLTVKSLNADALEILEEGETEPARYRRIKP
ncbi:MAG: lysozyme inhibitor LprI family protein [Methylomonas sp.]|nr:lysozyme inhibitor LprI family protein [Methylomonas sp.]